MFICYIHIYNLYKKQTQCYKRLPVPIACIYLLHNIQYNISSAFRDIAIVYTSPQKHVVTVLFQRRNALGNIGAKSDQGRKYIVLNTVFLVSSCLFFLFIIKTNLRIFYADNTSTEEFAADDLG